MGNSAYSFESRSLRSATLDYSSAPVDTLFKQNVEKKVHESMSPKGIRIREARDSVTHPNTVPIIFALDETGSMGEIPIWLVREGLPKLMSKIIEGSGIPDPALLFLGIGDINCDHAPLQVGQFESGDAELDMWLTNVWIERNGGGNNGESYNLAWYFAAKHTITDAWEKRNEKGFLFTIGDEPCLLGLNREQINHLMGTTYQSGFTNDELLKAAKEKWNVYHFHILQGSVGHSALGYWKELLGDNCIAIDDFKQLVDIMAKVLKDNVKKSFVNVQNKIEDIASIPSISTPISEIGDML